MEKATLVSIRIYLIFLILEICLINFIYWIIFFLLLFIHNRHNWFFSESLYNSLMFLYYGIFYLLIIFSYFFYENIIIFLFNHLYLINIILIINLFPYFIIWNPIYLLIFWINSLNGILIKLEPFISFYLNIDISRWWWNISFILSNNNFLEMVEAFSLFTRLLIFINIY